MANRSLVVLSITVLFSLVAVDARPGLHFHPCNTFFVSTFSFSIKPRNPNFPSDHHLHNHHRRPEFFAVVTGVRDFEPKQNPIFLEDPRFFADKTEIRRPFHEFLRDDSTRFHHEPHMPLGANSFRDRTLDILSVVASLLFGAACGALTAGTMYLIWSIFNNRHGDAYRSLDGFSDDDGDDDDDDIFNPKKKGGYVAVPATRSPADSAPAPPPVKAAPAKETV